MPILCIIIGFGFLYEMFLKFEIIKKRWYIILWSPKNIFLLQPGQDFFTCVLFENKGWTICRGKVIFFYQYPISINALRILIDKFLSLSSDWLENLPSNKNQNLQIGQISLRWINFLLSLILFKFSNLKYISVLYNNYMI